MTQRTTSRADGWDGRTRQLARLAVAAVSELSTLYAVIARILIGRVEDFSDSEAARRLQGLNLTAAKQQLTGAKAARRGS